MNLKNFSKETNLEKTFNNAYSTYYKFFWDKLVHAKLLYILNVSTPEIIVVEAVGLSYITY